MFGGIPYIATNNLNDKKMLVLLILYKVRRGIVPVGIGLSTGFFVVEKY